MPRRVGQYTLTDLLASSPGSEVYFCTANGSGETLVAKSVSMDDDVSEQRRSGVLREAGILRQVSHPHVVSLKQVMRTKHHIYLIFEYAGSGSLQRNLPVSEDVARSYIRQLVCALAYLHRHNIMHRDIKPSNVLVSSDRTTVQLSDLGFARVISQCATTRLGTPAYVAPEVIDCDDPDVDSTVSPEGSTGYAFAADVWSLGVTLYEALAGTLPFPSEDMQVLYSQIARGHYAIPPTISAGAASLIREMLTIDPSARATVADVASHPWVLDGATPAEVAALGDSLAGSVRKRICLPRRALAVGGVVVDVPPPSAATRIPLSSAADAVARWGGATAVATGIYDALPPPVVPPRSALRPPGVLVHAEVYDFSAFPQATWPTVVDYLLRFVLRSALCVHIPDAHDPEKAVALPPLPPIWWLAGVCARGNPSEVAAAVGDAWDVSVAAASGDCDAHMLPAWHVPAGVCTNAFPAPAPNSPTGSSAVPSPAPDAEPGALSEPSTPATRPLRTPAAWVSSFMHVSHPAAPSAAPGCPSSVTIAAGQAFVHAAASISVDGPVVTVISPCVTGGHLAALVPISFDALRPHLRQALAGLAFLHLRGIPMRHLAPYTLHVTADRRAVLLFGASRLVREGTHSRRARAVDVYSRFVSPDVMVAGLAVGATCVVPGDPFAVMDGVAPPLHDPSVPQCGIGAAVVAGPDDALDDAHAAHLDSVSGSVYVAVDAAACPFSGDVWSLGATLASLMGANVPSPWSVLVRMAEHEAGITHSEPGDASPNLSLHSDRAARDAAAALTGPQPRSAFVESVPPTPEVTRLPALARAAATRGPVREALPPMVRDALQRLLAPAAVSATVAAIGEELRADVVEGVRACQARQAAAAAQAGPAAPPKVAPHCADAESVVALISACMAADATARVSLSDVLRSPVVQGGAGSDVTGRLVRLAAQLDATAALRAGARCATEKGGDTAAVASSAPIVVQGKRFKLDV